MIPLDRPWGSQLKEVASHVHGCMGFSQQVSELFGQRLGDHAIPPWPVNYGKKCNMW